MPAIRHTPRLDAFIRRLDAALAEPGSKSDLARILAREAGIDFRTAKNRLSKILGRSQVPNGEDTLLFLEWLDGPPASPATPPARRKRGYS